MFDLDAIEQDWKTNSFRLSEEEIIEIYRQEGATLRQYEEEIDNYIEKINYYAPKLSVEDRLMSAIYGDQYLDEKYQEQYQKLRKTIEETPEPTKKHLSSESQKKVVEGSLYLVFDYTRTWYEFFDGNLSIEKIYYICLESLMNCVKYLVHSEKQVFRFYVSRSIERSMIKYVSRIKKISYRDAYNIIHRRYSHIKYFSEEHKEFLKNFFADVFSKEENEELEKPSKIFYRVKDENFDIDYIKNVSSDEFMIDYNAALQDLDSTNREVMELSFDKDGYKVLTDKEIGDYLGMNSKTVYNTRRSAIRSLRKNIRFDKYR